MKMIVIAFIYSRNGYAIKLVSCAITVTADCSRIDNHQWKITNKFLWE